MNRPETAKPLRSVQLLSGFLPVEKVHFLVGVIVSAGTILAEANLSHKDSVAISYTLSVEHTLPRNRASLQGIARWNLSIS